MKTKIFNCGPGRILLATVLFAWFVPLAEAQNLTLILGSQARRVLNSLVSFDSHGGTYSSPNPYAITNVAGPFNVSDTESTPGSDFYVSAAITASQNSTITSTSTNLSVTGQVEISASGSAVDSQAGIGSALWSGTLSEMFIGFTIDRSFTYSLTVSTVMNTNSSETVPIAMAGLDDSGDEWPDLVAYGSMAYPGGVDTAPSASGTSTGVFTKGTYYFIARVHADSGVQPSTSPTAEYFLATFNLSVNYLPPQPPVITAFTPNSLNGFQLTWNAPQAGNYRIVSSADLTTWTELIPSSAQPSGLNTNTVSAISGSGQDFFRIEYLP
jgi:hypothetical protein